MKFVEYPDREMMMIALAGQVASELRSALRQKPRASFCVPGGTTPGPVFEVLSGLTLEWDRVDVFLSDERWIPEASARSNTRLVKRKLLQGAAAAAHLVPIYDEAAAQPEFVLAELSAGIAEHLPIDVLLLGMGEDMHTASLIPGADKLAEALRPEAPVLVPIRLKGKDEARVTLSARVMADAMATHIVIMGAEKRKALERAETLTPEEAPVKVVLGQATVHWAE